MVEEHHQLSGHGCEQTPGGSYGQESLTCVLHFMGSQRVRHNLAPEQQQARS